MISAKKISGPCDTTCRMVKVFEKLSVEEQRILARMLTKWEKGGQRRHPRIRCSIITEYRALNQVHKGTIKNISLGGAYIENSHQFPLNLEINQSFLYPNFEIPIYFKSQIIWSGTNGFGVHFMV